MWGAIIGDIAGSVYEGRGKKIKTKAFEFFGPHCRYTDDSVCTAAVAEILLDDLPAASTLQRWCRRHPGRGYGGFFHRWIHEADPEAYGSYGNGAAMRVSPAAFLNRDRTIEDALAAAGRVTEVTHNHSEGLKGARATTRAIWLALRGRSPAEIRAKIVDEFGYDLSRSVDEIRPGYHFDVTCQGTVPEAITCALEAESFEDAVRNAISLGGDSDTLAAVAGPIAEAMHGVPDDIIARAKKEYLAEAPDIVDVMDRSREVTC
ncbi:ADP-ribosylglycohydrolase family protein [Candidatus Palauibacter sp.]|uniref:ADP-ribosylglycohydrolase family protein n=1 Tax=Candidatus Palauibacter sp. TaxID=3101350 RepID=UPI003CC6821B